MSTYCMYDRYEQCFSDCPGCPREVSEPDDEYEKDEDYDEFEMTEEI